MSPQSWLKAVTLPKTPGWRLQAPQCSGPTSSKGRIAQNIAAACLLDAWRHTASPHICWLCCRPSNLSWANLDSLHRRRQSSDWQKLLSYQIQAKQTEQIVANLNQFQLGAMSNYRPPPPLSDAERRRFASYPLPPMISLESEQPRRESLIEQQLDSKIQTVTVTTVREDSQSYAGNTLQHNLQQQQQLPQQQQQQQPQVLLNSGKITEEIGTERNTNMVNAMRANNATILASELAEKEVKLMDEINALHQRPYNYYPVPPKIDLSDEHRNNQIQCQNSPSPRPFSRASSTRSANTIEDLLEKEAKLMQEIEEMERKPFNPQRMIVDRQQMHKEPSNDVSPRSLHTAIIKKPSREIDNKSPLPFAFDNFSTKGVRGNIATVGAVEPERPRPPIYPIVRRTPSPNFARG